MDKKDTNPKDRMAIDRVDLSLFPATARIYGALAMTEGDSKYGGYNYRAIGVRASVYYASVNRHMEKWFNGEWADAHTGVPHLASALAGVGILIDAIECDKLNDDRPPKCNVAALLKDFENKVAHLHKMFPDGVDRYTEKDRAGLPTIDFDKELTAMNAENKRLAEEKDILANVVREPDVARGDDK